MTVRTLVALAFVMASIGCAAGDNPGDRDAGIRLDGGPGMDSGTGDSGGGGDDAGRDGGMPDEDAGPQIFAGTCEACEAHEDCGPGAFCISLTVGGRACVPACNPDIPSCPRAFNCVLDVASGVDSTVCLPIGGACCVDEDADEYGQGVGCMGADCNDEDEAINPGAQELCNGTDDDCDMTPDDPPTDCLSGRCSILPDGTYESIMGADCVSATCAAGTTTSCGLFTCVDGGELGNTCATSCNPTGTDDDTFCIAGAHCDTGVCTTDVPNGMECDEDSDCTSTHCDNGFCCGTGTCCGVETDCPGGGGVTTICEDYERCQGTRGMTECVDNQCRTMSGIADDSACNSTIEAQTCGLYDPVYCNGSASQMAPRCPTSCATDDACIEQAHCDFGFCVPDRPPGAGCLRPQDCAAGLFCVDGVCCTGACTGRCEACNTAASPGSCQPVPANTDPAGECPGFSCAGYYTGFGPGEDACYRLQDVGDAAASCNGGGACMDPATQCAIQPRGALQIDCNNTCQSTVPGTCSGMVPGACRDLDNPAVTTTCGRGECAVTVQSCTGGVPTPCNPGSPTVESCNTLDDDCDGTPDDGSGAQLCPPAAHTNTLMCSGGNCSFTCESGWENLNGTYGDGCECADDSRGNNLCANAYPLTALTAGMSYPISGVIVPDGEIDWFSVSFPQAAGTQPGAGMPHIRLTGPNASNFAITFYSMCDVAAMCGTGPDRGGFSFVDDQAIAGANQWTGARMQTWPTQVIFSVRRISPTTVCSAAGYEVTLSR